MTSNTNILEQFYILSTRGDSIIFRDFRTDATKLKSTVDAFYTRVTVKQHVAEPPGAVFVHDYINYIWLKKNTLYFVFSTRYNISPATTLELLTRLTRLLKDFLGQLNEETIRLNIVLIYELLDEVIDYGYIQTTSTDFLKSYVFNTPIVVSPNQRHGSSTLTDTVDRISSVTNNAINNVISNNLKIVSNLTNTQLGASSPNLSKTTPSTSVDKPVISSVNSNNTAGTAAERKNEIYVDIYERITAVFNSNAVCISSSIDGSIQVKSYLYGKPALKLALNDSLCIKSQGVGDANTGGVILDDCLFHTSVDLREFESNRMLHFSASDGEYTLMNYRVNGLHSPYDVNAPSNYNLPFRMIPHFELMDTYRCELLLQLRCDIEKQHYAGNVSLHVTMPKSTTAVSAELRTDASAKNQTYEYNATTQSFVWRIKKLRGEAEEQCRVKITIDTAAINASALRKQIGSVLIHFEVPMYTPSGLQVRYLRINDQTSGGTNKEAQPYRWVRYVTRSQSYVVRL